MSAIRSFKKMATMLSVATLATVSATLAAAETVSIEVPISEVADYFAVDLGPSSVRINFIVLSASGSSRTEWQSYGPLGEIPPCDDPIAFYPDVTVDLTPDHGMYRVSHIFSEDGAFAIADTVLMDLILPNGSSEAYVSFWNSLRAYFQTTCELGGALGTCRSCAGGMLLLDQAPVLTIDFTRVVATEWGNWGSVKARYR